MHNLGGQVLFVGANPPPLLLQAQGEAFCVGWLRAAACASVGPAVQLIGLLLANHRNAFPAPRSGVVGW